MLPNVYEVNRFLYRIVTISLVHIPPKLELNGWQKNVSAGRYEGGGRLDMGELRGSGRGIRNTRNARLI